MTPTPASEGPADYFLGLDLGQAQDYTALAVLEARFGPDPAQSTTAVRHYACRLLKRWQLGTKYPAVVADLAEMVARPPLSGSAVAVDQTGVGAAVVDFLSGAGLHCKLHPVLITGGRQTTVDAGVRHVPKKELVSTMQVLLQTGRLRIARELEHAATLQKELAAFRVKITAAANETFEAWRERDHDDMVLAVALAAWLGENSEPPADWRGAFAFGKQHGASGVRPAWMRGL